MGTLKEKLEYLGETKNQLKAVAVTNGVAVDDETPFRNYPPAFAEKLAKMDEYERFIRAVAGESLRDWNPVDGVATITTRGITYTASDHYNSAGGRYPIVHIYPESDIYEKMYQDTLVPRDTSLPYVFNCHAKAANQILDLSRLPESITFLSPVTKTDTALVIAFLAFPPKVDFNKACVTLANAPNLFAKGLSFGKSVVNMTAGWLYYSHTGQADKPVYVMEGFTGNLYLDKLQISAEHLLGIINNLGEGSYTLNIGSHNVAKLTDEQLQIAYDKGWDVT